MRSLLTWLGRLLLALALAALVVGFWKRDELMRLWTVKTLFEQGRIVQNFSHMGRGFHVAPVSRGSGPVASLEEGPRMTLPE
ncbi:MAG: 6-aminohexanoate hydrolase, partial [Pseudodonghicola sp.]